MRQLSRIGIDVIPLVASLLLVAMPEAPSSVLALSSNDETS